MGETAEPAALEVRALRRLADVKVKRMVKGSAPPQLEVRHNPAKKPAAPEAARPRDLEQQQRARTHAADVFSRFRLERLEGDALRAALPFKVTPGGRKVA